MLNFRRTITLRLQEEKTERTKLNLKINQMEKKG